LCDLSKVLCVGSRHPYHNVTGEVSSIVETTYFSPMSLLSIDMNADAAGNRILLPFPTV